MEISPYQTLDELESNETVKNAVQAGKIFYLDKTKDLDERIEAFSKYGKKVTFIHHFTDLHLEKISECFLGLMHVERYQNIDCTEIVKWWVDRQYGYKYLSSTRCFIRGDGFLRLKIETKPRNYTPSKEAYDRLYAYYLEKVFKEGVATFEMDW
jgi:hypothetical protein